jgi:superfamily II DNA helicase RecQ
MTANPSQTRRKSDLDVCVWKRPLKLDSDWAKYRANATLRFLREHKGPAIIYCTNPSQAEAIVNRLMPDDPQDGTLTVPFHEELPVAERQWLLHRFERGLIQNVSRTYSCFLFFESASSC